MLLPKETYNMCVQLGTVGETTYVSLHDTQRLLSYCKVYQVLVEHKKTLIVVMDLIVITSDTVAVRKHFL